MHVLTLLHFFVLVILLTLLLLSNTIINIIDGIAPLLIHTLSGTEQCNRKHSQITQIGTHGSSPFSLLEPDLISFAKDRIWRVSVQHAYQEEHQSSAAQSPKDRWPSRWEIFRPQTPTPFTGWRFHSLYGAERANQPSHGKTPRLTPPQATVGQWILIVLRPGCWPEHLGPRLLIATRWLRACAEDESINQSHSRV